MNKIKPLIKSFLPHLGIFVVFFAIVYIFFFPAFDGKALMQSDVEHYNGMAQELLEYGKPSGWTGSMFSGMPSYQITGVFSGIDAVGWIKGHLLEGLMNTYAGPIFLLLITSYILFLVVGARPWIAAIGSIAVALSSYNIIIIIAGHVTKTWAIAYTPLVFAGVIMIFRQRNILLGTLLFAFGLVCQILSNHLQITYYTALFCGIIYLGYLAAAVKDKTYKSFIMGSVALLIGLILSVGSNMSNLYVNYELGKETTRGQTELTSEASGSEEQAPVSTGLDRNYAFAFSYGKAETFTLLIPNLMGGISKPFTDKNTETYKTVVEMVNSGQIQGETANMLMNYGREYWGDQPFTSGPVYFGAVVCLLFVFAFFIVPGRSKWWLLAAAIFFIMLSWGKHLAWFNDFMFYHFPFYNKFRTVSMALVIPGFIFPMLAVMALTVLNKGEVTKEKLQKALIYSVSIVGGICLIFWIMPGMFLDFHSDMEAQAGFPGWFLSAMTEDRRSLLQADAMRSLIFILLTAALIFWYFKSKNSSKTAMYVIVGIGVLVLCDLFQVDRRYVRLDDFASEKGKSTESFPKTVANNEILKDKSPSYRVLNLQNTFLETATSYYHKSIGGYHAAKLRRYQDLIDRRLAKEIDMIIQTFQTNPTPEGIMEALKKTTSLDMLNTKYIIYNPEQPPLANPYHYGNAWFVDSYEFVDNADQEMAAIETINPLKEAVLDKKFADNLKDLKIEPDSTAKIELTAYYPDKLEYKSSSVKQGLAILSEIYYPHGWEAYIDGQRVPISRADWTLRAIVVPAGDHQIQLVFNPEKVKAFGVVNSVMSGIVVLLLLVSLALYIYKKVK